jgi:YegS/Rv2252/BmrU family lipid kinase
MLHKWFVIVNPTSGNCAAKKKWPLIYKELIAQKFEFEFSITQHKNHALDLIKEAAKRGFIKFICVGGDGTLHTIVNGILNLKPIDYSKIKIGIIPIGTGNDWIKTYHISKDYKKAIQNLKLENSLKQDIGKLVLTKTNEIVYFNNLAGIGFDGYVVNKVHKFKNMGFLAYLTGAIVSLASYKKAKLEIKFNNTIIKEKTLMLLIGICKYSGGGMQLTKNAHPTDGLFDVSHVYKVHLFNILGNLKGLFNGNITNHKLINNYKTSNLTIKVLDAQNAYIQADGELIGSGDFSVSILQKAISFIVPKK